MCNGIFETASRLRLGWEQEHYCLYSPIIPGSCDFCYVLVPFRQHISGSFVFPTTHLYRCILVFFSISFNLIYLHSMMRQTASPFGFLAVLSLLIIMPSPTHALTKCISPVLIDSLVYLLHPFAHLMIGASAILLSRAR